MALSPRTFPVATAVLLVGLTAFAYLPSLTATFVYEDHSSVIDTAGSPIAWSRPRALTRASYWVDRRIGGGKPWSFHLTNVLLHLSNGAIIYQLAATITPAGALIASSVFMLHPLMSETVSYAAGRNELLSTFFVLLAMLLWIRARTPWRLLPVSLSVGLAVMAKESAICSVGLLAAASLMRLAPRLSRRTTGEASVAMCGLAAAAWWFVKPEFQVAADVGRWRFASLQALAFWDGVWLFCSAPFVAWWPTAAGQSVDHAYELWNPALAWMALALTGEVLMFLVMGAIVMTSLGWWTRRSRALMFACLWIGSGVMLRFVMRIPEVLNEHQLYLAMAGAALAVGCCVKERHA